jgi:all-trans-retinol 13,14-reductase
MKYDYVIIGAGVAGMTAAIILAKNGFGVALVEQSGKTAPLIRGFTRKGVYFDTGFHHTGSLGDGEVLDTLFHYLGLADKIQKIPFDPDGFGHLLCRDTGFDFRFPYGYERIRERLLENFHDEADAINRYLQAVKDTFESFPYLKLELDRFDTSILKTVQGPSLQQFLDSITDNKALKWVLSIHCLHHGVPPEEVPFAYNACIVGSYFESVHGIMGGGRKLASIYDDLLSDNGVDVYCGQAVSNIALRADGSPSKVRLEDGTQLDCLSCVSTMHPIEILKLVPESTFRPAYRKRLQQLDDTCSAYMLFAGCNNVPASLAHKNTVVTSNWDWSKSMRQTPLENRPLYLCSNQQTQGPSEICGLTGIVPAQMSEMNRWLDSRPGKRPRGYVDFKEKISLEMQHYMERCRPEIAGNIGFVECATPLTLRDFTNTPFGSIYGVKHKIGQYNPMPLTKAKNLYLAGQAVVAPGIMGAVISAFLVGGFIIGHEQLLTQVQQFK